MRYGVQFQPLSGKIDAGVVRHDPKIDRQVFITKEDVTGQAIGAVALWLLAHADGMGPYQITDRLGNTYELTARIVPEGQKRGME